MVYRGHSMSDSLLSTELELIYFSERAGVWVVGFGSSGFGLGDWFGGQ